MNLKSLAIISIIIILFTITAVSADENATSNLQTQINEQDTVNITEDITVTNEIEIAKPTTINGNNHVLEAENTRIFKITSDNVILKDIIFKNGITNTTGGSILANGSIEVINCEFIHSLGDEGSAIYAQNADNLKITDSKFINCTSRGDEDDFFEIRDTIHSTANTNTITNCCFENDYAWDGVIYLAEAKTANIEKCTFFNTSAMISALECRELNISSCDFNYNYWTDFNGAIYTTSDVANIADSTFKNLRTYNQGGGIYSSGKTLNVKNCQFLNCRADDGDHGGDGGAIYTIADSSNIENCTFRACSSEGSGTLYSNGIETVISDSAFDECRAVWGGAISAYDKASIMNCQFNGCKAGQGGAVLLSRTTAEIINSTFNSCTADEYGGGIYANANVKVIESTFRNCTKYRNEYIAEYLANSITVKENNNALIEKCLFNPTFATIEYGNEVITKSTDDVTLIKRNIELPFEATQTNDILSLKLKDTDGKNIIEDKRFYLYANDNLIAEADTDTESVVRFNTGGRSEAYEARIISQEDDGYNHLEGNVIVRTQTNYNVVASDVEKYFRGPEGFSAKACDINGNPVAGVKLLISLNGETYTRTTKENGEINPLPLNLNSGKYNLTVNGEYRYTVTIKKTVEADNVTKVFRNATNYTASFIDSNGNKVASGEKVDININGVFYQRTVRDDGSISFTLNLEQGTYILTTTNPVTGENVANTVTILPRITENSDLTKYYRNDSQYTFTLIGDDGNPIANQKATININGVFYTRTTDENGNAVFQINLEPGTYILTVEYKKCRVSNTVTVLSTIKASDVIGRYGTSPAYTVQILDGKGNANPSQNITLNINGVLYNRTTNESGMAKLNINLMPGKYIITVDFNGLKHSNNIEIYTGGKE